MVKWISLAAIFLAFSFAGVTPSHVYAEPFDANSDRRNGDSTLLIASFNIRIFSDRSRDDDELKQICSLLKEYDFIAIQEARDIDVLDRAVRMLSDEFGLTYEYVSSDGAGRGSHKELYVFLFRRDAVQYKDIGAFIPDPVDYFIREPYYALFKAGNFDFYAINIHLIYGDKKSDRLQEARLLDDVYRHVQSLDSENDVLLMGDFNLGPEDEFLSELRGIESMMYVNKEPSTIAGRLYDNVWFQSSHTQEFIDSGVYKFDEDLYDDDDRKASLAVSDHRPLWARFDSSRDDD
jgi:endonuclease/exonuclease/phosphatase family metal-dependent hydrolase